MRYARLLSPRHVRVPDLFSFLQARPTAKGASVEFISKRRRT